MIKYNNSRIVWTEELICKELLEWNQKLGHFPSSRELAKKKKFKLIAAVYRIGKDWRYFKDKLGFTSKHEWSDNNVEIELKKCIENIGFFPTQTYLKNNNRYDLSRAIDRTGGFHYWRDKLGFEQNQRSKGFWNNKENVKFIIQSNFKELILKGIFPTQQMMVSKIGSRIADAISKMGINELAKELGCKVNKFKQTSDGHYVSSSHEFVVDEFLSKLKIPHEVDGVIHPSTNCRYDFKIGNFYIEVWGYENHRTDSSRCIKYSKLRLKKEKLYKELGLNLIGIEYNVFRNTSDKIEQALIKLLEPVLKTHT